MNTRPRQNSVPRRALRHFLCVLAAGSAIWNTPANISTAQRPASEIAKPDDTALDDQPTEKIAIANPNVVVAPSSVVVIDSEAMGRQDPHHQLRRGAIIYMISQGSAHRQAGRMRTELVVHRDGTAIAPGDHRNRESRYELTRAELDQLLNDLDVECEFFKILPDGKHFFELSGGSGDWDTAYDWVHVRDIERTHSIKCGYGWVSGTGDTIPSAVRFNKTQTRLHQVATLVRAGGTPNLPTLAKAANEGLSIVFPDLKPMTTADLQSAEHLRRGSRVVYFSRREGNDWLQVCVQQHDDDSCDAMSVSLGNDRRDIETPPIIRGVSLADFPVHHWTKSELYERRESHPGEYGRFYKLKEGFVHQDSGVSHLSLWVHPRQKRFFVEHSDGARRKVYGPISGLPADRLAPLPSADAN